MAQLHELKIGDIIDGDCTNPDVLVTAVETAEPVVWEENGEIEVRPMMRYKGRLGRTLGWKVKGDPRGQEWQKKEHSWCFPASSYVSIIEEGTVRL